METRLTLRPGMPGTKKLVARYGDRLVCVRYLYDPATRRRLKTVELVVEAVEWEPRQRRRRRRDLELVGVRIAYDERDLRSAVKTAGGRWRPRQKLREVSWAAVRVLGLEPASSNLPAQAEVRHLLAYRAICRQIFPYACRWE